MTYYRLGAILLLLSFAAQTGFSQAIDFKEYTLSNGLRVILAEDHSAPTYSIAVTYDVGSRDEKAGRTGFAHLFEHMMFQGSENVGKGEHMIIVQNYGGASNGTTNADRTNYYQTLPANQIELGLFLESDRMRSLVINQANLDNQRETVKEERRQRYDNQAYGRSWEALMEIAYDNFAYSHSTIGSIEDLDAATVEDAADFFRVYYAPNNAVLSMVGDFDSEAVLARIRHYFEDIPAQEPPPVPDMTEPRQTAERRDVLEDPLAQLTQIDIAYKIPSGNTPEWYALAMAGLILSEGRSSRLYELLVREEQSAQSVSAGAWERRGPGVFWVTVLVRPGEDPREVEELVYGELERLKETPVSDDEIEKIHMLVRRADVEQLETTLDRATSLGRLAVYYGDANLINTWAQSYYNVTKEQIQEAARAFLVETNRSVLTTVPRPAAPTPTPTEDEE